MRKEGYEPVGQVSTAPYNSRLGFPFGKRPARIAIAEVNEANPGLQYDGIRLWVEGSKTHYQPYRRG